MPETLDRHYFGVHIAQKTWSSMVRRQDSLLQIDQNEFCAARDADAFELPLFFPTENRIFFGDVCIMWGGGGPPHAASGHHGLLTWRVFESFDVGYDEIVRVQHQPCDSIGEGARRVLPRLLGISERGRGRRSGRGSETDGGSDGRCVHEDQRFLLEFSPAEI